MARATIGLLGAVTTLFPESAIDVFERVAVENSEECTTNSWIVPAIRTEGIVITVACLIGGRAYAWMMNLTGAFGVLVLLFPQLYREFATALLYERPDEVEWNDRFTDSVRIIGATYVLLALRAFERRRDHD